jgi:hypothetical protein
MDPDLGRQNNGSQKRGKRIFILFTIWGAGYSGHAHLHEGTKETNRAEK